MFSIFGDNYFCVSRIGNYQEVPAGRNISAQRKIFGEGGREHIGAKEDFFASIKNIGAKEGFLRADVFYACIGVKEEILQKYSTFSHNGAF